MKDERARTMSAKKTAATKALRLADSLRLIYHMYESKETDRWSGLDLDIRREIRHALRKEGFLLDRVGYEHPCEADPSLSFDDYQDRITDERESK